MLKDENSGHGEFQSSRGTFGIFRKTSEVNAARLALQDSGFSDADIRVLYPPHRGAQDFTQTHSTSIINGAMIGAAIGGPLLMIAGLLVGLRAVPIKALQDATAVPSTVLLVFAGLVVGLLFGAASGALVGIGTPESANKRYGEYLEAGGILLSVHVGDNDEAQRAKEVLEKSGASDINLIKEGEAWDYVYTKQNSVSYEGKQVF